MSLSPSETGCSLLIGCKLDVAQTKIIPSTEPLANADAVKVAYIILQVSFLGEKENK